MLALMLAAGGVSAWFALREPPATIARAVPGAPSAPPGGGQARADAGDLPQGHPSIELPQEVLSFLDQLTAEAQQKPTDVEANLRLARARYRASVLNPAYRQPARQALDTLFKLDAENQEGIRISANLAYDEGRFAEAEKGFQRYLAKQPDDPSALTDLGSSLLFQERVDEATASYRKALEKDPSFLQARFNLGIALQRQGKSPEALVELKKAAEIAKEPEQKQHIENAIAELEGREPVRVAGTEMPSDHPPVGAPGGAPPVAAPAGAPPVPAPAGAPPVAAAPSPAGGAAPRSATNASTDFQKGAETLLTGHPIVGPRIRQFQWTGAAAGKMMIADFPMDKMPPVVRNKFKSGMNQKLTALAAERGVTDAINLELVDASSGSVMDKLDGKEMVGAFDPQ